MIHREAPYFIHKRCGGLVSRSKGQMGMYVLLQQFWYSVFRSPVRCSVRVLPLVAYAPALGPLVLPIIGLLDAYGVISLGARDFLRTAFICLVVMPVVGVIVTALVARKMRVIRELLLEADYAVCVRCLYSLRGLPHVHTCPECGASYDAPEIKRQWLLWMQTSRWSYWRGHHAGRDPP